MGNDSPDLTVSCSPGNININPQDESPQGSTECTVQSVFQGQYLIECTSGGLEIVCPDSVTLIGQTSATFTITVILDGGYYAAQSRQLTVKVRNALDINDLSSDINTVIINIEQYAGIGISGLETELSCNSGQTIQSSFEVTNEGNQMDFFSPQIANNSAQLEIHFNQVKVRLDSNMDTDDIAIFTYNLTCPTIEFHDQKFNFTLQIKSDFGWMNQDENATLNQTIEISVNAPMLGAGYLGLTEDREILIFEFSVITILVTLAAVVLYLGRKQGKKNQQDDENPPLGNEDSESEAEQNAEAEAIKATEG